MTANEQRLIERWKPASKTVREATSSKRAYLVASMLEAQLNHTRGLHSAPASFNGTVSRGRGDIIENVVPGDIAAFTTQSLAMIDQIFEEIVIDQLVSMRTMDGPTAFVHTTNFKQGDAGVFPDGTSFNAGLDPDYANCPGESTSEACQTAKEVDFELTGTTITAVCKRLTAKYTVTAEQDLNSQYGESLPDKIRRFMAVEIAREIQGQVMALLIANAGTTVAWSKTPAVGSVYENLDPKVYQETLYDAIKEANTGIFKSVDGGRGADWIAADPDSLLVLDQLNAASFHIDTNQSRDRAIEGDIERYANLYGVANHRYKVWNMRRLPADTIVLGLKGDGSDANTGHIHATYIPLMDLGMFRNPRTGCVDTGVLTRYANVTTRPGLFALINLT
jgi:hypothetical protein